MCGTGDADPGHGTWLQSQTSRESQTSDHWDSMARSSLPYESGGWGTAVEYITGHSSRTVGNEKLIRSK